jgi:hypothetical protein
MTKAELEAIAKTQNANPYYVAYALATGAQNAKEAFVANQKGKDVCQ